MRSVINVMPELDDPASYPNSEWYEQRSKYWAYWYHFDGDYLDEQVSGVDKYPLKLNIFNMACMLHAGFLFGEVPDGSSPLVVPVIEPWGQNSKQEELDLAKKMSDLVVRVLNENYGRALQQEGGIISQVLGGCVFGVAKDTSRLAQGKIPIRLDFVLPEYFFPVWAPTQYWNLMEAIIAFQISAIQARDYYGVDVDLGSDQLLYQEHWRADRYEITVGGKTITWNGVLQSGKPAGGIVPYTYIPHIRVGQFYGRSLLEGKQALAEEVNSRMADLGDVVADAAGQIPAIWNTRSPSIRRVGRASPLLDLGNTIPGMSEPGISYPSGSRTNTAMTSYVSELINTARIEAYTPPVCYGIDEGSQRSALTLALRMIPLIVHIRQERSLWTDGLNQIARHILLIAAEQGIEGLKPEDVARVRIWQDWAPILPRDRDQEVNELILRLNSNLVSVETALSRLGDVRDIKTEMNLIKEWMEYRASLESQGGGNPFAGAGSMGEQSGLLRPVTPQPSLKEENDAE